MICRGGGTETNEAGWGITRTEECVWAAVICVCVCVWVWVWVWVRNKRVEAISAARRASLVGTRYLRAGSRETENGTGGRSIMYW